MTQPDDNLRHDFETALDADMMKAVGLDKLAVTKRVDTDFGQTVYNGVLAFDIHFGLDAKMEYTYPDFHETLAKLIRRAMLRSLLDYLQKHNSEDLAALLAQAEYKGAMEAFTRTRTQPLKEEED